MKELIISDEVGMIEFQVASFASFLNFNQMWNELLLMKTLVELLIFLLVRHFV